jgi:hypothetical protein
VALSGLPAADQETLEPCQAGNLIKRPHTFGRFIISNRDASCTFVGFMLL